MAVTDDFVGVRGALGIPSISALMLLSSRDWTLHPIASMAGAGRGGFSAIAHRARFVFWMSHWQPRYFPKTPRLSTRASRAGFGPADAAVAPIVGLRVSLRRPGSKHAGIAIAVGAFAALAGLMSLRHGGGAGANVFDGTVTRAAVAEPAVERRSVPSASASSAERAASSDREPVLAVPQDSGRVSPFAGVHRAQSFDRDNRLLAKNRRRQVQPSSVHPRSVRGDNAGTGAAHANVGHARNRNRSASVPLQGDFDKGNDYRVRVDAWRPAQPAQEATVGKPAVSMVQTVATKPRHGVPSDTDWMQHMTQRRLTDIPQEFSR